MALVAGACTTSLLVFGWYAYSSYTDRLLEQAARRLEFIAARQKAAVLATIDLWEEQADSIAQLPALSTALQAYRTSGDEPHLHEIEQVLARVRASIETLHRAAVVDLAGRVLASTDDRLVGHDMSGRQGFARGQTEATVGDIVQNDAGEILVVATSPLRFEGELVGILFVHLGTDDLLRLTEDYAGLGKTGETLVVKRGWRGDAVLVSPARFDPDAAFRKAIRPNRPDRPITHALRRVDTILVDGVVDYRDVPVLAATRYIPEVDWGIVAKIDREEVLAPAWTMRDRLLLIAATLLAAITVGTRVLSPRLTASLRQMGDQVHAVLSSIADGIITIDAKGRIMAINPAAKVMFGYSGEELIGNDVGILMPPPHSEAHGGYLETYRRTRVAKAVGHRREVEGRRRNGETFPIEIAVSEVVIKGRQCFTAVVLDISARKRAEQEIERQSAELVRANDELAARNQELDRLYRTAHQFMDNVSHDFRTPLSVIKEYASIIRDGSLGDVNEDQTEFLDTIMHRSDDLSMMVNDVLDLSKLDAGLLAVSRRPCTLEQIVERCRPVLESQANAAQVRLEIALDPGLPTLFGDPEKLGRVIVNLAVNACKFVDGGGQVQLWARHDAEAAHVVIGVTDNGPGIGPDNLRAIFERFNQVGDVRKSAKGFGLGLAIVKELVELNLGNVSVESREGEGSTFWFTVPTSEPLPLLRRFLSRTERLRPGSRYLTLLAVDLDVASPASATADELEDLLRRTVRSTDLILRAGERRLAVVAAIEQPDPSGLHHRMAAAIDEARRRASGETLPEPKIAVAGTWSLADGGAALIERFEGEYGASPARRPEAAAHHAA